MTPPPSSLKGEAVSPSDGMTSLPANKAEAPTRFTPTTGFAPPAATAQSKEATPASKTVSLHPGTGTTATSKAPVEIPSNIQWQEPQTVVKAKPGALPARGKAERAVVTFVQDGDTASLRRGDNSTLTCRIDTIDAPETAKASRDNKPAIPGQRFGRESQQALAAMIENKEVTLRITKPETDQYGRNYCQIEIHGKGVDEQLVRSGLAWVYDRYVRRDAPQSYDSLKAMETEARTQKRGLWVDPEPMQPEFFRRLTQPRK